MRFKRQDLPGILIATVAPVLIAVLFLSSYELWDHHGTPLLPTVIVNLAVGAGIIGALSRFIRNWDMVMAVVLVLVISVVGVLALQQSDNDGTALATALKWVGVVSFLALNLVIVLQLLTNGLIPILNRRETRQREEAEAQG
ncbi:MAG: hypothetical protein GEU80_03835 [Dehalococcoidia bacterium]|nr:hypothetical protein [Dehalococcoidia bacterium]